MLDELLEADVARLRTLDEGELHVRVEDWWIDDHQPCLDVEINEMPVSLWWLPLKSAAAFYFTGDSPAARAEVVRVIREEIELGQEDADESDPDPES
jgi:hypothetical protein